MKVTSVEYKNYRNLEDGFLVPCDGVNVIYGDNAQGKTNLIEALWLFCGGHSFRTSKGEYHNRKQAQACQHKRS